jgi:hypothetical protein
MLGRLLWTLNYSDFCFDHEIVEKDGFSNSEEMRVRFEMGYKPGPNDLFDTIRW